MNLSMQTYMEIEWHKIDNFTMNWLGSLKFFKMNIMCFRKLEILYDVYYVFWVAWNYSSRITDEMLLIADI